MRKTRKSSKNIDCESKTTRKSSASAARFQRQARKAAKTWFAIMFQPSQEESRATWLKALDDAKSAARNVRKPTRETVTRIAWRFEQEGVAECHSPKEIKRDAQALAECGQRARTAVANGKSLRAILRQASEIAERYNADIVDNRDLLGMVLGLEFRSEPVDVIGRRVRVYVA